MERTGVKYWYFFSIWECPLCGHSKMYKERRYTPKPENYQDRYEYETEAYHCGY